MSEIASKNQPFGSWNIPYATDGLVAMWDGEHNVGTGQHDQNAKSWVDLVGNREVSIGSRNFDDDCLMVNGNYEYISVNEFKELFQNSSSGFTYEHVFSVSNHSAGDDYIAGAFNSWNQIAAFVISKSGIATAGVLGLSYSFMPVYGRDNMYFFSLCTDGKTCSIYERGLPKAYSSTIGDRTCSSFYVLGHSQASTYIGKSFSTRIYNRQLSQEEIFHNYQLDEKRFGI